MPSVVVATVAVALPDLGSAARRDRFPRLGPAKAVWFRRVTRFQAMHFSATCSNVHVDPVSETCYATAPDGLHPG